MITPGWHAAVADDEKNFATAAVQLLNDAPTRACIAALGHELVKRHYSWDVLAESFDRVYQEVVAGNKLRQVVS